MARTAAGCREQAQGYRDGDLCLSQSSCTSLELFPLRGGFFLRILLFHVHGVWAKNRNNDSGLVGGVRGRGRNVLAEPRREHRELLCRRLAVCFRPNGPVFTLSARDLLPLTWLAWRKNAPLLCHIRLRVWRLAKLSLEGRSKRIIVVVKVVAKRIVRRLFFAC